MLDAIAESASRYCRPQGVTLSYGTAGFRARADILDSTFFRMGMLAALRSRALGGLAVGLMVTASHNAEPDNGIKLVDPDGGMLTMSWERYASAIANAAESSLASAISAVASEEKFDAEAGVALVLLGRDTRTHSPRLAAIASEGAKLCNAKLEDCGLLTTPQLHHLVRFRNATPSAWASEGGYYQMLAGAFRELVGGGANLSARGAAPLWVDAAHGVGGAQLQRLAAELGDTINVVVANDAGEGELNEGCGAEFVQKQRLPPRGFEAAAAAADLGGMPLRHGCSLDGDADRIVFFYISKAHGWRLLDGDKICALAVAYVKEQLQTLQLETPLSLGAVQTAYANGASGRYIRSLGVSLALAKTGVKFVHHAALEYDVAVYFEANGHGTLLFSEQATAALLAARESAEAAGDAIKVDAAKRLLLLRQLVNQAVGDAFSDLLLVEAILTLRGWGVEEWDALYDDLPSRQSKLPVKERAAVLTTPDESRATKPAELQPALDELMGRFPKGRCFVRPSGTEDVVRVYAEAETQREADELALLTAQATWRLAGGVGEMPSGTTA